MKYYLTEAQAWRGIAQIFLRRQRSGDDKALCIAVQTFNQLGLITKATARRMIRRVQKYMQRGQVYAYGYYSNVDTTATRRARGMAALWLALDAEAEHGR